MLGLWIEQSEGAKFWLKVMNELKTRGVGDILIAVVDGLKGFPEAIAAVFPETMAQTCISSLVSGPGAPAVDDARLKIHAMLDTPSEQSGAHLIYCT